MDSTLVVGVAGAESLDVVYDVAAQRGVVN
jgi:hypothetical protein